MAERSGKQSGQTVRTKQPSDGPIALRASPNANEWAASLPQSRIPNISDDEFDRPIAEGKARGGSRRLTPSLMAKLQTRASKTIRRIVARQQGTRFPRDLSAE